MQLIETDIAKFQKIYLKIFGRSISSATAQKSGIKLVRLMQILCETSNK